MRTTFELDFQINLYLVDNKYSIIKELKQKVIFPFIDLFQTTSTHHQIYFLPQFPQTINQTLEVN